MKSLKWQWFTIYSAPFALKSLLHIGRVISCIPYFPDCNAFVIFNLKSHCSNLMKTPNILAFPVPRLSGSHTAYKHIL